MIQQGYAFPPLYGPWMAELLGGPIPDETKATCNDCVMCGPPGASDAALFDRNTKCCTYMPRIPNYLTGRILDDHSEQQAEGRATVLARIERRTGVTPLGLQQTERFNLLYANSAPSFGRALELRCPHYLDREGGQCGIWRHRTSTCATWFCKHVRGEVGQEFWKRLNELLSTVESELAIWCASELHAGTPAMLPLPSRRNRELNAAELDGPPDLKQYNSIWGQWRGKEHEFYSSCARLVEPLTWPQIVDICGPQVRMRSDFTAAAYRELTSDSLPERLVVGKFTIEGAVDGDLRVSAYRSFDPLLVSNRLARALPYFTGQRWEDAALAIRQDLGFSMSRQMVRRLVDFGLLVDAGEGKGN